MKRTWKQIGSLFLAFCMVFTILPTMAFTETGNVDSGTPLGVSRTITAFAPLEKDVAEQIDEVGTAKEELKLPNELAITLTEGGDETATGSDAAKETQTTVVVSGWTAAPEYDGDAKGVYTFTPTLELPDGINVADGVAPPTITVTLISVANIIDLSDSNPPTSGTGWTYDSVTQVYTIANNANVVINNSNAGSQRRIEVAAGAKAKITLDGVSISGLSNGQSPLLLNNGAEVNLSLWGDSTLSAGDNCAGIQTPAGTTLIIRNFEGGALTVTGGANGAGIGGGANSAGGSVTISDWVKVTATGGANSAGIGGGANGAGGTVTISDWDKVTATGGTNGGAAIGGGSGSSGHGSLSFGSYTNFRYWTNISNSDPGGTGMHNSTTAFPEGGLDTFKFIRIEPEAAPSNIINLSEIYPSTSSVGWSYDSATQVYTIANNADVSIINSNNYRQRRIEVTAGAKAAIKLDGASISLLYDGLSPLLLKTGAEVTITLVNNNTLIAGYNCAGIQAPAGTTLILCGEGSLSTEGGENGAGIGGANSAGGTITIKGNVNVTATGGRSGAGIGGAIGAGGTITISGNANVTAIGGRSGAGIGGAIGAGGTITINGNANVTATGGSAGAGIGGSAKSGDSNSVDAAGGTITIGDNANVTATGGYASAGIGGGKGGKGGNVRITGGTVKATGSSQACAIGSGNANYIDGTLDFGSYTDFRYWTNTRNSDPGGDGTLNRVTPFPETSRKTFEYIKIAPESAATVPSAPQSFTATPGDSQAVLSWTAPASNGGAAILRYEVSSNNGASWVTAAGNTAHTFISLTNGTSYTFKVRAVNSAGKGVEVSAMATPTAGGGTISGTIKGSDTGSGLAGATVWLFMEGTGAPLTSATTDAGGVYAFHNIPAGAYHIEAQFDDYQNSTISGVVLETANIDGKDITLNKTSGGATTYAVTVHSGTASTATAAASVTVTITASAAPAGQRFKAWTVQSGGVTLANKNAATTSFTMPVSSVEVTATYEDIPAGIVPVTGITLNRTSTSLYSNTTSNTVTLTATVAPANATDKTVTWQSNQTSVATVDANGKVTAVGNGTATITGKTTDGGHTASCTVTVTTYTSGSGGYNGDGSSSGGSSSGSTTTAATPGKTPDQPVTAAPVIATAGTNGTASAAVSDKAITDAIAKAQADAKAQGNTANGISVALNVTMPQGATALTVTLTRSSLNSLVSAGVTSLELNGSPVTVSFDTKALTEIQKQSSGNISITIVPNTSLSASAKTMIGARPVYDLTVSYTKDSKNATVSSFGGGTATVSVPYTPAKGEAVGGLYVVYVDAKGNATRIAGSAYDANSGCVMFTTTHFSLYGIGYTAPSAKFTDIKTHWAKESIDYVVGRGLLSGTSEATFAPNTAMTRGMLVTALGKLAGMDVKAYTTNSFSDVKADSAFRPYIEWAYKKGVVQGIGNGQFAPDRAITREEIAVIFVNFAKATGYTLPVTRNAATFADASSIGSAYKTAVMAMQQAGIMMGEQNNKFNPKASATRAEVSAMLHRYIKLTIDSATAQGWAKNDDGQYMYYKDSKALTGTQTIGGVKYFFNTDGTLKTGWVKDGDNWRYYSGNKAAMGWLDISAKRYYFTKDGVMVDGKWLEISGKWYYFNADGSLAKNTKVEGYEVDENGVRKSK